MKEILHYQLHVVVELVVDGAFPEAFEGVEMNKMKAIRNVCHHPKWILEDWQLEE